MSSRGLRARLKRLEKKIKMIEPPRDVCGFRVDPVLAKALRDDHRRANELEQNYTSSAEWLEATRLRERNIERAKSITCPADYGAKQAGRDGYRLSDLSLKRWHGGSLTNADDVEEAQLTARVAAYEETAEGRGRRRIDQLMWQRFSGFTPEEKSEYEHLQTLYPALPMDPDDPMKPVFDKFIEQQKIRSQTSNPTSPTEGGG
jgi:hypothetical protein